MRPLAGIFVLLVGGVVYVSSTTNQGDGRRLIKTSEEKPGKWMTENEIFDLIRNKITFMDATDSYFEAAHPESVNVKGIPTNLKFNSTVQRVVNNVNIARVQQFVEHFSSYHNRYYNAQTGRASQLWQLSQVAGTLAEYAGNVTLLEVDHGYLQRSIVARLIGTNANVRDEVVILGAHLDSLSLAGANEKAPGADDNASGSVVVLEVLRAIVDSGLLLNKTVEFHWYAAEEIGLHGSQAIAEEYRANNVSVVGMLNLDVVGYYVEGLHEIGIYTDNGSPELINFTRILTDGYLTYGRRDKNCGYACSDHASWYRNGYASVFAAEAIGNPHMHSAEDTIDKMEFSQIAEFVKLGIGFAVEMAEPK